MNFIVQTKNLKRGQTSQPRVKVKQITRGSWCRFTSFIMHQLIPATPSPPPAPPPPHGLLRGICRPCQSRGWGICKFLCAARGPGICWPLGHSRAFFTHAVSYQNRNTQMILLGKKADWLICHGQERRGCKGMFLILCTHFFICCQNYIAKSGTIDVNQRFMVIESNFCWYYLKNILSYV